MPEIIWWKFAGSILLSIWLLRLAYLIYSVELPKDSK